MQNARFGLAFVLMSCGGGTDISEFEYGGGQPGALLAEGGEIRHEHTTLLGTPQTWLAVYAYGGPAVGANAPFPAPADGGAGQFGNCVDERQGSPTWPFKAITGATYLDLPKVELTGPGITGVLDVIKTDPPNTVGNSTFREYGFTYGGGAPGDVAGFNAGMTTPEMSTPGGEYTVDIGIGAPMTFVVPEAYTPPNGIGGAATVQITPGQDLVLNWQAPPNDFGDSGLEHNKNTHFNFTFFADPSDGANHAQFICFPAEDGTQVIPQAVIDALPPNGLIVNSNLTHFMEAREVAPGDLRRFDLVGIYCNISLYSKE